MFSHSKENQTHLTPDQALTLLREGNDRFVHNLHTNLDLMDQLLESSAGQFPFATILSCIDSRTSVELIFDQGLGDIFSVRIAGNVLNDDILGSMEFATKLVGTKVIVVLGHTKCGAIAGACNNVELGHLSGLLNKIKPAIEQETTTTENRNGKNLDFLKNVTEIHTSLILEKIRKESPIIAELEAIGEVKIVGALYDIDTGIVHFHA
jgi:carbonic anhydrase